MPRPADPASAKITIRSRQSLDAVFDPNLFDDRTIKRSLNPWQQGDLVSGVRLFWASASGGDVITNLDVDPEIDGRWPIVPWDGTGEAGSITELALKPGRDPDWETDLEDIWGVITSQTCDIMAIGPGRRHPFVQVSPVVRLTKIWNAGSVNQARRGHFGFLTWVPNVPADGDWFADLRISMPVSKAILIEQYETRRHGFRDERESSNFIERVAAKTRRPALHDEVSNGLTSGLQKLVGDAVEEDASWPDEIEQFRILTTDGDRLDPKSVTLYAITIKKNISAADMAPLRKWQKRERKRLEKATDGCILAPVRFVSADDMSARVYRDSDPLFVPELRGTTYW